MKFFLLILSLSLPMTVQAGRESHGVSPNWLQCRTEDLNNPIRLRFEFVGVRISAGLLMVNQQVAVKIPCVDEGNEHLPAEGFLKTVTCKTVDPQSDYEYLFEILEGKTGVLATVQQKDHAGIYRLLWNMTCH